VRIEGRSHAVVRFRASWSDPFGLGLADSFGNSLADSVSFRFPSRPSLDGAPLLPANSAHDRMAPCEECSPSALRIVSVQGVR